CNKTARAVALHGGIAQPGPCDLCVAGAGCYHGLMSLFEVVNISASYLRSDAHAPLLSNVSFSLSAGGVYDLVGPSGSGKSTLLRVCALMLARDGGELFLDGAPSSSFVPSA